MPYDRDSFLAGIAVGRNLQSWPEMHGFGIGFFAFTIQTVSASFTYQFGITFGGTIDWGDGTAEDYDYNNFRDRINHVYANAGVYQVKIIGHIYDVRLGSYGTTPATPIASANRLISVDTPFPRLSSPYGEATYANLESCFAYCANLKAIPKNLFANYKAQGLTIRGMQRMFYFCTHLKTIPQRLFKDLTFELLSYDYTQPVSMFYRCSAIEEFPSDLFDNPVFTRVTNVRQMFSNCTSLKSLPVDKLPFASAQNFEWFCRDCESLLEIPEGLFDDCTQATLFNYVFSGCDSLTAIPDGLFDNCPNIHQAEYAFSGSGVVTIPHKLFADKHSLQNAASAFSLSALQTFPGDIFDGCDALTTASSCFAYCSSLADVPSGLFNGCTALTDISRCFNSSGVETISSDLCYGCTALTRVDYCFSSCGSLTSIPSQLFSTCSALTDIRWCFYDCTALGEVPFGLFDSNLQITQAERTFSGCTSLYSVYTQLFMNNPNDMNLRACFYGDSAITSSVPELWIAHPMDPPAHYNDGMVCFYGCVNAANYADIPAGWGGPG